MRFELQGPPGLVLRSPPCLSCLPVPPQWPSRVTATRRRPGDLNACRATSAVPHWPSADRAPGAVEDLPAGGSAGALGSSNLGLCPLHPFSQLWGISGAQAAVPPLSLDWDIHSMAPKTQPGRNQEAQEPEGSWPGGHPPSPPFSCTHGTADNSGRLAPAQRPSRSTTNRLPGLMSSQDPAHLENQAAPICTGSLGARTPFLGFRGARRSGRAGPGQAAAHSTRSTRRLTVQPPPSVRMSQ